jgi:riboflavin kinase/FMN adenylyltransferase
VIGEVRRLAAELGAASAVVTFDPHPASVVRPESAPLLLTDTDQRLELLAATGVDYTLLVPFDLSRSKESAEDFVREVLVGCMRARAVVVGGDFHFGHQRRGDVPLLRELGKAHGFEVDGIELLGSASSGAQAVSSTGIRAALAAGDLAAANRMLGRPHRVRGTVVRGDARGRELGFPTANIEVPPGMAPVADGVYAGWYERPDGSRFRAAISIGTRQQFYDDGRTMLEAHLLDFTGDLYGERATVDLVIRLSGQAKFESVEKLVAKIQHDVEETRRVLS